jgi:hypothetical protein
MPAAMSPERAEILGLEALAWLAADPDGLARFQRQSGVDAVDLRAAAGSPELGAAIIDFLLLHEDLLIAFCEASETEPAQLHRARRLLLPEA